MQLLEDVSHLCGTLHTMKLDIAYVSQGHAFENVVGVYFEDADHKPFEAVVLYPSTQILKTDEVPLIRSFLIPLEAHYMGYWIGPNMGAYWTKQKFEYQDTYPIHMMSNDETHFPRLWDATGKATSWYYTNGEHKYGRYLSTGVYGGSIHLSNSDHNRHDIEFFRITEEGTMQIEDWQLNSGWDFNIRWESIKAVGCDHCKGIE